MTWGCYKHEVDVDSESWKEKEMELSVSHSEADGGKTWGLRHVGICPWCVEEYLVIQSDLLQALKGITYRANLSAQDRWIEHKALALIAELNKELPE